MDNIRQYEHRDFEEVRGWYEQRGIKFSDRDVLPVNGFIVPGVAAGFIYMTDSSISFIEGFVTNPKADSKDRSQAIDEISYFLIRFAEQQRCRYIKCESKVESIVNRAKEFGFRSLGQTTSMVKEV